MSSMQLDIKLLKHIVRLFSGEVLSDKLSKRTGDLEKLLNFPFLLFCPFLILEIFLWLHSGCCEMLTGTVINTP